ncbi:helix-turn-helix transcriptional regulator [Algoriphagus sp. NG3]|uniref:helix-turn-helix domain-containing protein n=1 Tax=Algoriphagus sp. NG3 TaxID=3097546 RepID=UPI002A800780|nr:helix-turn-helix transcriptional regulator [Algoriphagus sp. NG3]WPR76271.1 helix-turn-helix transcriptional regulator [Algoriphagus sp. NG3]
MKEDEKIIRIVSALDLYVIEKIRNKREDSGMSQDALSVEMGFSDKLVGNIENPSLPAKYNIRQINLAAEALKCNVKDFLPPKGFLKDDLVRITVEKIWEKDNDGINKKIPVITKSEPLTEDEILEYNRKRQKT